MLAIVRSPMTEIGQRTPDAGVTPVAVLLRHVDDQAANLLPHRGPPGTSTLTAVVLASNQLPMPAQQGVGRDDRGHLPEQLVAQLLGPGSQAAALIVVES